MKFRRQKDIFETKEICDVPRSEMEVYRIARKEYRGLSFIDIRVFRRALEDPDHLVPLWNKGIWIEDVFLDDVIAGLIKAQEAACIEKPINASLHEKTDIVIEQIPATEREVYRITKGHEFVEIRRYMKIIGDKWRCYQTKGIVIQESSLEDVIHGLKRARTRKAPGKKE